MSVKRYVWLGVGAVVFAIVLALLLSGCGGGSESEGGGVNGEHEAQGAMYACEEDGGVISVADEDEGYLNYVVCKDGTVVSWERWYGE